jgi:hypothetical protein
MTRITRRTADIMVSVDAALYKVRQQNCQRSLHKKGSGKVPVDFQAIKVQIIFPGLISKLGHTDTSDQESLVAKGFKTICHWPFC